MVAGQRVATGAGAPLARRHDAANERVCLAGIYFIGSHAHLNLPGREELVGLFTGALQLREMTQGTYPIVFRFWLSYREGSARGRLLSRLAMGMAIP